MSLLGLIVNTFPKTEDSELSSLSRSVKSFYSGTDSHPGLRLRKGFEVGSEVYSIDEQEEREKELQNALICLSLYDRACRI